ncbi:hypothetical protein PV08_09182 [Exophiala spinifera]|uniref:Histidine acid phosphatase n=1 Tax=Exophiala spinifera TaxID=91928 RepID=A0A0D2BKZ6_9EURO|nr:uncharacterized protein PV08_09182 [Exophiala spinifera]KIW11909.1 hypothetical protein PV08_09182 [Exophiala spinifera]
MARFYSVHASTLFFLSLFLAVAPQTVLTQQVLSTFIYTRYGDRTPLVLSSTPSLTPLGAQQLYAAGAKARDRYISPTDGDYTGSSTISGIAGNQLAYDQINVLSTDEQYVSASALAFLQGLYPPLELSSNWTYIEGQSTVANGTNIVAPLNGYQYPQITTISSNDLNSIWVNGMDSCPSYTASGQVYYQSPDYQSILNSTMEFYRSLQPEFLDGIFSNAGVGYYDAFYIYDYLSYAYTHNSTVRESLREEDLTKAKILADDWVFAMNADLSASGTTSGDKIRAIAGRTLATRLLTTFNTAINTQGQTEKMTLLFGSHEPMISFAALTRLISQQNAAFYNVPAPGSSFIFELVSMQADETDEWPNTTDIYVRFLYQNGTDSDSSLVEYSLFGLSPSQGVVPFLDFVAGLEEFLVSNVGEWCTTCGSYSVFCPAFTDTDDKYNPSTGLLSSSHKGLSPAIAGVIGAVVTLAVAALLFAAVMLLGGVRLHRVHTKPKSEMAGFKGGAKMASDQDLVIPKGGAGATMVVAATEAESHPTRGHERVGSWELRDQVKAEEAQGRVLGDAPPRPRRPSYEDDELPITPYTPAVDPHDHV